MMRERARRIVESQAFGRAVPAAIVVCAIIVGLEQSSWLQGRFETTWVVLDWVLAVFFVVEMLLRLAARPVREFFHVLRIRPKHSGEWRFSLQRVSVDHDAFWNVFDLIVVAISCGSLAAHFWPHPEFFFSARLLRATRLLMLLGLTKRLRRIERNVAAVLPTVFSFIMLLTILLFVYAVFGSHLFGGSEAGAEHFGSLEASYLTMCQVMTLDSWSQVMRDLAHSHPLLSPFFFSSFIALTAIVMLNVFIAVLTNELHGVMHPDHIEIRESYVPAPPEGQAPSEVDARVLQQLAALEERMAALQRLLETRGEAD